MSKITDYVLGFAFDQYGAVALINKKRPDWQAGKWNGIGGHREPGETGHEAMSREFHEETGMLIGSTGWRLTGQLKKAGDYRCLVYTTTVPLLRVHTMTDEQVKVFSPGEVLVFGATQQPQLANIASLLKLCRMEPDREDTIPLFTLDYTKFTSYV